MKRILMIGTGGTIASGMTEEGLAPELTPEQLLRAMRPHPSFEEALTDALEDLAEKLEK